MTHDDFTAVLKNVYLPLRKQLFNMDETPDPLLTRLRFMLTPFKIDVKRSPYNYNFAPEEWLEFTRPDGRAFRMSRASIEAGCSVLQELNGGREIPSDAHYCQSCCEWIDPDAWRAEHYIHCLRARHNLNRRY